MDPIERTRVCLSLDRSKNVVQIAVTQYNAQHDAISITVTEVNPFDLESTYWNRYAGEMLDWARPTLF